jgi:hypothetical protein
VPQTGEPFHICAARSMNARLNLMADTELCRCDVTIRNRRGVAEKAQLGRQAGRDRRNSWFLTINLYERLVTESVCCSTGQAWLSRFAGQVEA